MADAGAAVGMDRLPWLEDEPAPRAQPGLREPAPARAPRAPTRSANARELAGWAVASILLVAGASYWLGTQSADQPESAGLETGAPASPEATVRLPEPRAPAPVIETPQVVPPPLSTVDVPEPRFKRSAPRKRAAAARRLKPMEMKNSELSKAVAKQEGAVPQADTPKIVVAPAPLTRAPAPAARPLASREQLRVWPARVSRGASGRLVQIGAFGSRQQAKLGWRRMKRSYPAVARLPAVVVEARNSRGRRFYRFQIGTTSQAHSEVLCQRMESIGFSCAVVGLPWKAKVER